MMLRPVQGFVNGFPLGQMLSSVPEIGKRKQKKNEGNNDQVTRGYNIVADGYAGAV